MTGGLSWVGIHHSGRINKGKRDVVSLYYKKRYTLVLKCGTKQEVKLVESIQVKARGEKSKAEVFNSFFT